MGSPTASAAGGQRGWRSAGAAKNLAAVVAGLSDVEASFPEAHMFILDVLLAGTASGALRADQGLIPGAHDDPSFQPTPDHA